MKKKMMIKEASPALANKKMTKYYFGIDIGGTFIKGAIVDENGNIIASTKVPTERMSGAERVYSNVIALTDALLDIAKMKIEDITAIGIGVPGTVDSENGVVSSAMKLGWKNFDITKRIKESLGLPARVANDANAAALGELKFGFKSKYKNLVLLTLGTGVGGGIIIDGKLYDGNKGAGAEIGHSVIDFGGEPCNCGRRGCLEAYCSASAIIRDTKRAMEAHPDSKMWQIGTLDKVDGKTAFDFADTDPYAKAVVDGFITHLACGVTNMANIFRPEAVVLGGGVCAQGKALTDPIQETVNREIYGGKESPQVEVLTAKLQNDAGSLGAAALVID